MANSRLLDGIADQLSFGIGVIDSETFNIIANNSILGTWLGIDCSNASIEHYVPGIKLKRLQKVAKKSGKYRANIEVKDNGHKKDAKLVVSKISADDENTNLLLEVTLDSEKQEIDALISNYQETMENYKAQLEQQKELTVEAVNAKAALLSNMNEQLERDVKNRTMELESAKSKLSHQANHDVLTGLPNRRLFDDRLQHATALSLRNGKPLAVFYMDLDKFKQINDRLGHNTGDELLKVIAERLQNQVRMADTISRLGGDEFCIISEDTSRENAEATAKKIIDQVTRAIEVNGYELYVSVSIGICMLNDVKDSNTSVTQGADAAMYEVKATGKNGYLFFNEQMESNLTDRVQIELDLRQALDNDQLFLVYQPIINLKTMKLTGCEALVRWQHPVRGEILPGEFLSIAEETGLIKEIGQWILEAGIDQITAWQSSGLSIPSVSINLSGKQLEDTGAMNDLLQTIKSKSIDPTLIEFELTESLLMSHTSIEGINCLEQLKANGHQIAIDDFGTGYSSLSYLRYLPVTALKIDRSFVQDLSKGEHQKTIVAAILAIADCMKLEVTAEGIETNEQRNFLIEKECNQGQGYLFSKPLSAEKMEEYAASQNGVALVYQH